MTTLEEIAKLKNVTWYDVKSSELSCITTTEDRILELHNRIITLAKELKVLKDKMQ